MLSFGLVISLWSVSAVVFTLIEALNTAYGVEETRSRPATLALVVEEALVHLGAVVGHLVSGSDTWGEWIGGSVVAAMAIPLAAFTTSIAYQRLARAS